MSDTDLLHEFVRRHDQRAFAEIARRHIDMVYAAARRQVNGDSHLAEDVTQQVFVDLARKAPALLQHPCLAGWLYACTRFTAISTVRGDQRRRNREKEACEMDIDPTSPDWARLRPVIDEALEELDERDRQWVVLRFFGQQSYQAIAEQSAVTENAAQKAVARALDLLNSALARRGITSTATALALALAESSVAAPPALLSAVTVLATGVPPAAVAVGASGVLAAAKLAAALVIAGSVSAAAGYWTGMHRQIAIDATEAQRDDAVRLAQIRRLEQRVRAEANRSAVAEADTATLLRAIDTTRVRRVNAAAAEPVPLAPAVPGTRYAIQPGDTPAKIVRAYGISMEELSAANRDVDFRRLRVGQLIALPPGAALREAVPPGPGNTPGNQP